MATGIAPMQRIYGIFPDGTRQLVHTGEFYAGGLVDLSNLTFDRYLVVGAEAVCVAGAEARLGQGDYVAPYVPGQPKTVPVSGVEFDHDSYNLYMTPVSVGQDWRTAEWTLETMVPPQGPVPVTLSDAGGGQYVITRRPEQWATATYTSLSKGNFILRKSGGDGSTGGGTDPGTGGGSTGGGTGVAYGQAVYAADFHDGAPFWNMEELGLSTVDMNYWNYVEFSNGEGFTIRLPAWNAWLDGGDGSTVAPYFSTDNGLYANFTPQNMTTSTAKYLHTDEL